MTTPQPKRGPGRPRAAETSRKVTPDKRTKGGKRLAEIERELQRLAVEDDGGSITARMRVTDLQVQRWTLLSCDAALNHREQREASSEAARWTHEYRQLSQRQADDLIRELGRKMLEQEDAADRLEKL